MFLFNVAPTIQSYFNKYLNLNRVYLLLFLFLFLQLHYISPNLGGGGTASPTAFTSVFAYIGTPPQLRRNSRLTFRQGPCHLLEDIISSTTVQHIYSLGPTYIGSFQAAVAGKKQTEYFISCGRRHSSSG